MHEIAGQDWSKAIERARHRFVKLSDPLYYSHKLLFGSRQSKGQDIEVFNDQFNRSVRITIANAADATDEWTKTHSAYQVLYLNQLLVSLREPLVTDKRFLVASKAGLKEVQELAGQIATEHRRSSPGLGLNLPLVNMGLVTNAMISY